MFAAMNSIKYLEIYSLNLFYSVMGPFLWRKAFATTLGLFIFLYPPPSGIESMGCFKDGVTEDSSNLKLFIYCSYFRKVVILLDSKNIFIFLSNHIIGKQIPENTEENTEYSESD